MTIEECLAAAEDALLLAFRIDLDEIDRGPASRTVFRIEGGDPHRFSRTAAFEAVQLARRAEHEMAFPRTVGRRRRDHMQIVRAIDAAAALEQGPRLACRLVGEHVSVRSDAARERQAVDAEIGPDVD